MGRLIEQSVKTLFQGISRQPDSVRLPGQLEEADNALLSVVTGGFEKRAGSQHVAELAGYTASTPLRFYGYDRDTDEQYIIIVVDGDLKVYDLTGDEKTVDFPDGKNYLNATNVEDSFAMTTVVDFTFITNKEVEIAETTVSAGDDPDLTNPEKKSFDASTFPHVLVRNADGTFTFREGDWLDSPDVEADEMDLIPDPDFVGFRIQDILFFRNRVGFVSDETIYFTQAGDYFNFWPDNPLDVIDSDPFGLTASSPQVNVLNHATNFRRAVFATSNKAQFEISSDGQFTARTSFIDYSTAYLTEPRCAPFALGSELYFAARSGADASIFEYYYDDNTISNTATDITVHAKGYVPAPVIRISGDSVTGTMFLLSDSDRNAIYIYRLYWDGDTKAQSAWSRWVFTENDYIHGFEFLDGRLYVLMTHDDATTHLYSFNVDDQFSTANHPYPVRLDRRVRLTGIYDAETDTTTWTLPWDHEETAQGLLSTDFSEFQVGRELNLTYLPSRQVSALGDFSSGEVIFGYPYRMSVTLSRLYPREGESGDSSPTVTAGRMNVRRMTFDYQNTGGFDVVVEPKARDAKRYTFTGRILGDILNQIGKTPIVDQGTYTVPIKSRGDTVRITVESDYYLPVTITSMFYTAFFNEITRQDG